VVKKHSSRRSALRRDCSCRRFTTNKDRRAACCANVFLRAPMKPPRRRYGFVAALVAEVCVSLAAPEIRFNKEFRLALRTSCAFPSKSKSVPAPGMTWHWRRIIWTRQSHDSTSDFRGRRDLHGPRDLRLALRPFRRRAHRGHRRTHPRRPGRHRLRRARLGAALR
jgi:hypothetical protein